jgi:hypothetical protein
MAYRRENPFTVQVGPNVLLRRVPVLNESVQPIKAGLGDG